jgi:7-carboxy-7-deazaguanine synthase
VVSPALRLRELSSALVASGYQVQIETSGTSEVLTHEQTW